MESRSALRSILALAGLSAVIGLTGSSAHGADIIRISGSSTVFPITKAANQGYRTTAKGKPVDFDIKETGQRRDFVHSAAATFPWPTHRAPSPARS